MYKFTLAFVCFTLLAPSVYSYEIKDVSQATCRINNRATGIVFAEDKTDLWVITAGHVMTNSKGELIKDFYVQFFNGKESKKFKAEALWHVHQYDVLYYRGRYAGKSLTTNDLGFIKVNKKQFGTYPIPKPIPLAPQGTKLEIGQKILSSGYPGGKEKKDVPDGIVIKKSKDKFDYTPAPVPGQSGSGIVTDDGIVGIVIWYFRTNVEKDKCGTAISLDKIYKATKWDRKK
jgi:V8-like Glu-specific endopeptidase